MLRAARLERQWWDESAGKTRGEITSKKLGNHLQEYFAAYGLGEKSGGTCGPSGVDVVSKGVSAQDEDWSSVPIFSKAA